MNEKNSDHETPWIAGRELIRALIKRARELGMDKYELADAIGITYPYLIALSNGSRPIPGISHDKLRRMASFLGLTFVQVLMLAEIVKPEDFVVDQEERLDLSLERAIENMRMDEEWGRIAPSKSEWSNLSRSTRLGIAMMWERVSQQDLIEKAKMLIVDPPVQSEHRTVKAA
jgi:transcriptional regulator with XRE-family HTH domain